MVTTILTALSYLVPITAALFGGAVIERHRQTRQLRRTVSAAIDAAEQQIADPWDTDTDQWEQVANALDFPLHDYRKETT